MIYFILLPDLCQRSTYPSSLPCILNNKNMLSKSKIDISKLKTAGNVLPCVSLIFPFTVKYGGEHELHKLLKLKSNQLHHSLSKDFPEEVVSTIMKRYFDLITHVPFHSFIKGYAFYLSSTYSTYFELHNEPKEKLIIDDNFEIRDLLIDQAMEHKFIVLLMSESEEKFLKYESGVISVMSVHVPKHIEAFMQNTLHDVEIYYEKSDRQEKARDFFIKNADAGLEILFESYPWPVIVMAPNKLVSHYKLKSKYTARITGVVEGNFLESTEAEILAQMHKVIPEIEKAVQTDLMLKIEKADNDHLLCYGIQDIWKELSMKNGRELILEKNFVKAAIHSDVPGVVTTYEAEKAEFPIQDAVDDLIEMAMAQGGEIKFVEDGALGKYRRVALIKYHAS